MSLPHSNYTRVTDALYPFSGLSSVPKDILANAADRGSRVHEFCEARIQGIGIPRIEPELLPYVHSFDAWYESMPRAFIDKPERFYCDIHMLTGECDAIYKNDTGLTIVDFKTPLRPSKTWALQGSAYSYLAKQVGLPITQIEFVQLKRDGKPGKSYFYEEDFGTYLKCLDIYRLFFKDAVVMLDF